VGTGNLGISLKLTDNTTYSGSGNNTTYDAQNTSSTVSVTYTYLTGSDTGHLLTNGSFELPAQIEAATTHGALPGGGYLYGTDSAATGLTVSAAALNSVPGIGWNFQGAGIVRNGSALGLSNAGSGGSDGDQAAFVQDTGNMSQNFTAATKGFYKLTFVAEQQPSSTQNFEALVNGVVLNTAANGYNALSEAGLDNSTGIIPPISSGAWNTYTLYTQELAPGTYSIEFLGLNMVGGDNSVFIDSVNLQYSYSSVPGPPSIVVFVSGVPLLLLRRRRRTAAKKAAYPRALCASTGLPFGSPVFYLPSRERILLPRVSWPCALA